MFVFLLLISKTVTKVELDVLHAGDGKNLLERSKELQAVFKEVDLSFVALNKGLLKTILKK